MKFLRVTGALDRLSRRVTEWEMIICRTPYRISFFGGGTDYPTWIRAHGGAVLSTTIDKYCYITCRELPPFFEHRTRVVYSKMELVRELDEIQHPLVREVMRYLDLPSGLEIHYDGDLPARSGMGSSSAFTVGLLHTLYALKGSMVSKRQLASEAVYIEQVKVADDVGCQDQYAAAFGGFNRIDFMPTGEVVVQPVTVSAERFAELNDHLLLFYTGLPRDATTIAKTVVKAIPDRTAELQALRKMVDQGLAILQGSQDIIGFGKLLHEAWRLKRDLSSSVSNDMVDQAYAAGMDAGAFGGKLLGAGGGGFLLMFARPKDHARIIERLGLLHVPFRFESSGTQIIFYDPPGRHGTPKVAAHHLIGNARI
jgi:D-glycero-alpha-D-manno-heptose-7-phosphate kinase